MSSARKINWKRIFAQYLLLVLATFFIINFAYSANLQMEWGNFTLSPQTWTNISMQNSYVSPIIIVSPEYTSTTQDRGMGVWLDNVTENSFLAYTANHQFDSTNSIKINYFVIEEGNWTFPNTSSVIEAGKLSTNRVGFAGTGNWECPVNGNRIFFTENFSSNPIVFSTRATNKNNAWAVTFQNSLEGETQSPGVNGACIGLSQANAPSPTPIINYETVYWVAMDEFHSILGGVEFEALWNENDTGTSGDDWINGYDDSRPFNQNWQTAFSTTPTGAIVSQTSNNGGEGGWAVLHSLSTTNLNLFIDENIDRSHTKSESGGGFAFTGPISFGNEPPNSTNISIVPTFTFINDTVLISVNVTDPQSVFTIKNVTATIESPNTSTLNFSLQNSPPSDVFVNSSDLESQVLNFSVPPNEDIWLEGWNYRKAFQITGSTVDNLSNYTVRLNVFNKEGVDFEENVYVNGRAQVDYDDIRFTNSLANETGLLPYWKEREGTDFAIFWVKLDNISQHPENTTFYIYYGNSSVSSSGNGSDTFLYFEDFEGYSSTADDVRPPTWQNYNLGTVLLDTEANGNRALKKTANNDPNGGQTSFGLNFSNYELIWKTNRINNLAGAINRYGISDENANGYSTYSASFGNNMRYRLERRTNGNPTDITPDDKFFDTQFNTWYIMRLSRYEGNFRHFFMDLTETVFEIVEVTDNTYSNFNTLYIHGGQEYLSDDFLLRKYVEPEPIFASWSNERKWLNEEDGDTLFEVYSGVDNSLIQDLTAITVKINVTQNSFLASDENSNTFPSIEVGLSNSENADWEVIGSIFPSLPGLYSITTTDASLLENWRFDDNRNLRIRGVNMDYFNSSIVDLIEWDFVNVQIDYEERSNNWFINFNETGYSGIYNVTNIIVCDKGALCNSREYINESFEITDKGNLTLVFPTDNQKFIGVFNRTLNLTWNVFSATPNNNCSLFIDSSLVQTFSCPSGVNVSYLFDASSRGTYTWEVESVDELNVTSFSDTYTFYVIPNTSLQIKSKISNLGTDVYLKNISTNSNNEDSRYFKYLDFVQTSFVGGSYSRIFDLFQIVLGVDRLFYWNVNETENITYSYTSNVDDYYVSDLFTIGLE